MSIATIFGICAACLVGLGLYGLIVQPQPLRKILAFNILGGGIFLLFGAVARHGAAAEWAAIRSPSAGHHRHRSCLFGHSRSVSPFCCGFRRNRRNIP
jgi:multisubunit Na+/H+ antiporter MnhC subunit